MASTLATTSFLSGAACWAWATLADSASDAATAAAAAIRVKIMECFVVMGILVDYTALGRLIAADLRPATACARLMPGTRSPCRVTSKAISSSRRNACTVTRSPTR